MESLACVCVCVFTCVGPPSAHISYISMCHFPQRVLFQNGWRRLAAAIGYRIVCVCGPGELGKTLGVPFEGRQLCWAYLSVWLAFFCSFVIRESLEEGIVKNTHNHHPTLLLALLCFSLSLSTRCVDSGGIYDVRIESIAAIIFLSDILPLFGLGNLIFLFLIREFTLLGVVWRTWVAQNSSGQFLIIFVSVFSIFAQLGIVIFILNEN